MNVELVCKVLVVIGMMMLLIVGLVELARCAEKTPSQGLPESPVVKPNDTHRLSVAIADALMQNRVIDPARVQEATQIVALKIELHRAFVAPGAGREYALPLAH